LLLKRSFPAEKPGSFFFYEKFCNYVANGNHATLSTVRKMDYTLEVIGRLRSHYAGMASEIRVFLLGFSKSGWGAMNLLLQHPQGIDGMLIWDAPLSTDWNEKWGMRESFGDKEHFTAHYMLPEILKTHYSNAKDKKIVIAGYDLFENESRAFVRLLREYDIPVIHDSTMSYQHRWNREWIMQLLGYADW
jgi:hypothetical protein